MTTQEVFESIDIASDILKKLGAEPILFGSLLGATINSNFYREVGDIDIITEQKYKYKIENYFLNAGFNRDINKDIGFISVLGCCPTEFSNGTHNFSFIFGNYKKEYFELSLKYGFSFRWPKEELCYKYELKDRKFLGFSPEFYFLFLTMAAKKREKRKKDIEAIFEKINPNKLLDVTKKDFIFWHNNAVPLVSKLHHIKVKWLLKKKQNI